MNYNNSVTNVLDVVDVFEMELVLNVAMWGECAWIFIRLWWFSCLFCFFLTKWWTREIYSDVFCWIIHISCFVAWWESEMEMWFRLVELSLKFCVFYFVLHVWRNWIVVAAILSSLFLSVRRAKFATIGLAIDQFNSTTNKHRTQNINTHKNRQTQCESCNCDFGLKEIDSDEMASTAISWTPFCVMRPQNVR